jgi:hypothetical protein
MKSNKNVSWKKCIFALANLQNYKRVKIRMDDRKSQIHWGDEKSLIRLHVIFRGQILYRYYKGYLQ